MSQANTRNREPIEVGVIGTGWCGGIRAVAASSSPMVAKLHLAEIREERLAEVTELTGAERTTTVWEDLVDDPAIAALMISATPETTHYPMARAALAAGKHVLLRNRSHSPERRMADRSRRGW
jgi:predicted dehydrogenase